MASTSVRTWMASLDMQTVMYDLTVDPTRADYHGPVICIFWHEYLLTPFYLRGNTNSAVLTSRHRDANWIAESARHLGFDTIRGSTARGGTQALLQYIRGSGMRNLGIACDGPRGPRRRLAQGPIYLSSRLQIPLVLYGVGYDRPWRMPTWDRFAIPRPGSRARIVVSPRVQIPARMTRPQLEHYRDRVGTLLSRLTLEAEAWATAGTRKQHQIAARREPCHRIHRYRRHAA